jgi:hypothetical protein
MSGRSEGDSGVDLRLKIAKVKTQAAFKSGLPCKGASMEGLELEPGQQSKGIDVS